MKGPGKGHTNNPKGKPKGATNKENRLTRELITRLIEDNWDLLIADIQKLDSKERVKALTDLMKYSLPALSAVQADISTITEEKIAKVRALFPTKEQLEKDGKVANQ